MVEKVILVTAENGIHAYPASLLAQCLQKFEAEASVTLEDRTVNAKSTLKLMTLGAESGSELKFVFDGADEENAMSAVVNLFEINFKVKDEN